MTAGSIYDADNGKRPLRYSIDGRVVEGTIVDREGRDVTGEETGNPPGATLRDALASLRQARGGITSKDQPARSGIAEAIAKYRQIRHMEAQFPNPGAETIKVHRSGLLRTPNPRDQARFDADKANYDLAILEAHLVTYLTQYVVNGKKHVLDAIVALIRMDEAYPAEVQPFAEHINEYGIELLIEVFKQGGEQLGVFGLEEIARAMLVRKHPRR